MKIVIAILAMVISSVTFAGVSKTTTCLDVTKDASHLFEAHSEGMKLPSKHELMKMKGSSSSNGKMAIDVFDTIKNGVKLTKIGFSTKEEVMESVYAKCVNSGMWKK